ncbi:MAG: Asp-tRNA(Asn)/Glu-tRNA(Gln) amidotransferase subunit GatC [Burkholderiales bacterium]|nr:Asp-tRNA(Asn)/Glu-tRNA(Gln) amidotransferase subunit GatC [Burkholderiales bacterium]
MSLTLDDVKRVAMLARIEMSESESAQILEQLGGVFKLIEQMQSIDTADVEPMAHAQDVVARLRPDAVTEADQHDLFQSQAPEVEADLYLVPKVIE